MTDPTAPSRDRRRSTTTKGSARCSSSPTPATWQAVSSVTARRARARDRRGHGDRDAPAARAAPCGRSAAWRRTSVNAMLAVLADQRRQPTRGSRRRWPTHVRLTFDAGQFDAVVCQFGLMFFPDKVGALAHMRRVVKPGRSGLRERLGHRSPRTRSRRSRTRRLDRSSPPIRRPSISTPFGLHDEAVVRDFFTDAGFT